MHHLCILCPSSGRALRAYSDLALSMDWSELYGECWTWLWNDLLQSLGYEWDVLARINVRMGEMPDGTSSTLLCQKPLWACEATIPRHWSTIELRSSELTAAVHVPQRQRQSIAHFLEHPIPVYTSRRFRWESSASMSIESHQKVVSPASPSSPASKS